MADERFKAMTTTYDEMKRGTADQQAKLEYQTRQQCRDWRSLGAIVGLSGGIIAALTGALLTASTWFIGTGAEISSYIQTLGTILLFMTIPLLIFGAQCLDLTEKRKERERDFRFHRKR
ncbi:MAG: hypothetical protein WBP93_15410 [Pyrinomonadaceae bacterium]